MNTQTQTPPSRMARSLKNSRPVRGHHTASRVCAECGNVGRHARFCTKAH